MLSYLYCQCHGSSTTAPSAPSPSPVAPLSAAPQNIQAQYKAFWKTMNGLRNHSWHRWLKTEKIGILLSPMITILDPGIVTALPCRLYVLCFLFSVFCFLFSIFYFLLYILLLKKYLQLFRSCYWSISFPST